jgi:hypothetical protein
MWKDEKTGKTLAFIPSRIWDNPYGMEADPGYYDRLKDLPEKKFKALAEGSWEIAEGVFFEDWDERKHVLRQRRIPDSSTLKFLGFDWGYAEPACVLWLELMPSGRVFVYRELYTTQLHPKELAKKILEMSPPDEFYESMVASPEIWGKTADMKEGGETIQQAMQNGLGQRIIMQKANRDRVSGWLKLKEWIGTKAGDGLPWLQVSPNCENLIRTMPGLIYDIRPGGNPEDADGRAEDHAPEALRYACMTLEKFPRGNFLHPNMSSFDNIYGQKDNGPSNQSHLPKMNRGGY